MTKYFLLFTLIIMRLSCLQAQVPPVGTDSVYVEEENMLVPTDSIGPDSARVPPPLPRLDVKVSKESFSDQVKYSAEDSMHLDVVNQKVYLYGGAEVNYLTTSLSAGYMEVDLKTSQVEATGFPDSTGNISGLPEFKDKDQSFVAKKLQYNFKSHKGIIYDATTQQDDIYVLGRKTKFLSEVGDPNRDYNIIYSQEALITTCDHPHPHFGIRSRKQKIIPGELVVLGPSNLEIADVPTPLWLPFGFFPITKNRSTGLIFPRDYEFDPQLGYGLANIGYFMPLSDYMNLYLDGDIYLRGTWRLKGELQYKRRYLYSGNFSMSFSDRRVELANSTEVQSDRSFQFFWRHNQDNKAHPYNTFGGTINIQTNDFQSLNQNDFESVTQSQLTSNLSFNRRFPNSPFTLSSSFQHSQNTRSGDVTITFPRVDLRMNQIFPFDIKSGENKEKWFEKISLTYNASASNRLQGKDSTLFSQETLESAEYGFQHSLTNNATFKVFEFFNVTPFINYTEDVYFQTVKRFFDPTPTLDTLFLTSEDGDTINIQIDTVSRGMLIDSEDPGVRSLRQVSTGVRLFTQVYGTMQFRKGWVRGIRHMLQPSIDFTYTPDYTRPFWNYFDTYTDENGEEQQYAVFDGRAGLRTPSSNGLSMALNYSFENNFEAKVYNKKTDKTQKLVLFKRLSVGGFIDFAKDSLQFSPISISGPTTFFKGMTTIRLSANYDYYALNENGTRINTFHYDKTGRPLRFDGATANINSTITVDKLKQLFKKEKSDSEDPKPKPDNNRRTDQADVLSLIKGLTITHNLNLRRPADKDTLEITTHTIRLAVQRIQITPQWGFRISNISYNFANKNIGYPDFTITRNLHCWEMGMSFQPVRGTFNFYVRATGSLNFLNVPYRKSNLNVQNQF